MGLRNTPICAVVAGGGKTADEIRITMVLTPKRIVALALLFLLLSGFLLLLFSAPEISVDLTRDAERVQLGERFRLHINIKNTGTGVGRKLQVGVWLTEGFVISETRNNSWGIFEDWVWPMAVKTYTLTVTATDALSLGNQDAHTWWSGENVPYKTVSTRIPIVFNRLERQSRISINIQVSGDPKDSYILLYAGTDLSEGLDTSGIDRDGRWLLQNISAYFQGITNVGWLHAKRIAPERDAVELAQEIGAIFNASLKELYPDANVFAEQIVHEGSEPLIYPVFELIYNETSHSLIWILNLKIRGVFTSSSEEGYIADLRLRALRPNVPLTFARVFADGRVDQSFSYTIDMASVLAIDFSFFSLPLEQWDITRFPTKFATDVYHEIHNQLFQNKFGYYVIDIQAGIEGPGDLELTRNLVSSAMPVPEFPSPLLPFALSSLLFLSIRILSRKLQRFQRGRE